MAGHMKKRAPLELDIIAGLADPHLNQGSVGRFDEIMALYIVTMIILTSVVGRAIPPAADGQPWEK